MINIYNIEDQQPNIGETVIVETDEGYIQAKYLGFNKKHGDNYDEDHYNPVIYKFDYLVMDFHGCGCCGGEDPTPQNWFRLPERPIS